MNAQFAGAAAGLDETVNCRHRAFLTAAPHTPQSDSIHHKIFLSMKNNFSLPSWSFCGRVKAMSKLASIATRADQAYEALLAEILDGRLAPSAKIIISDVAARLGTSPGAVREALSRLS